MTSVQAESADAKLLEFLGLVAGLLGIIVVVLPSSLRAGGVSLNATFVPLLIGFMFNIVMAYLAVQRQSKDAKPLVSVSIGYFSVLLAFALASNVAQISVEATPSFSYWYVLFAVAFMVSGYAFTREISRAYKERRAADA